MAQPIGDLTASMAILGLLIKQPDSARRIKKRLAAEYPHGRWSRSTVPNNLSKLADRDLIRRIAAEDSASEGVWVATPEGVSSFKEHLLEAVQARHSIRDATQLWLEHSTEDERPEMIAVVRELEEACKSELQSAQVRLNTERTLGNLGPDWQGFVREATLNHHVMSCGAQALWFKKLREKLEGRQGHELHTEASAED